MNAMQTSAAPAKRFTGLAFLLMGLSAPLSLWLYVSYPRLLALACGALLLFWLAEITGNALKGMRPAHGRRIGGPIF